MDRKILVIITIIATVIIGGTAYLTISSDADRAKQDMTSQNSPSQPSGQPAVSSPNDTSKTAGDFVDYSSNILSKTSGTRLLFFHAPWCPQCLALETDIKKSNVPGGVTIIKVDYDTNQALRQKYGVTLQTTVVRVDDNGNLVEKYVAYDDPTLDAVVENLL